MPAFDYSAYNVSGKLVSGVISADSERQARRLLKDKKLIPSALSEVGQKSYHKGSKLGRKARVDNLDLSLLLHQQAILIQSGLPLEESLRMTIEQAETDKQRRLVESWRSEITEGRSFSEALRRSPYQIPESIVAGVGVGEETGHLHKILLRLSEELETSAENRKTVTRALIYPVTLVSVSIVMVSVMMVWVVPKITAVFASSNRELPWITEVVVGISNFTQSYGLYVLVFVVIASLAFRQAMKNAKLKMQWHELILSMPGMGRWVRMADISDWSRNLGVLLNSGVPALAALKISSAVVNNCALQDKFNAVTEAMRQGASLHKALEDNLDGSGFLVHMVGSGEASSELDKMLLRVAEYYSARLKNAVEVFLKLLNPILILIMGAMILGIVAAIMLPIMDMNNTI
ncbi:MAG: type II secretion system F family protein [Porticoccaceae bacterium]|jgi:general secretion pathway protein F|nr:type II secretion system F family protein [Porticoccaceae bacterium]PDH31855.1 MAG: general secretion pathway protein GspF [SAR92 bacterium MED-G29]|tara:strand:- start:904 stop:2115 length:1212 start_codon:yes stop_codon:yes gene_type:complete